MTVTIYISTFAICSLLQRDYPPNIRLSSKHTYWCIYLLEDAVSGDSYSKGTVRTAWVARPVSEGFINIAVLCVTAIYHCGSYTPSSNPKLWPSVKHRCTSMWHCKGWDKGWFIIPTQAEGSSSGAQRPLNSSTF